MGKVIGIIGSEEQFSLQDAAKMLLNGKDIFITCPDIHACNTPIECPPPPCLSEPSIRGKELKFVFEDEVTHLTPAIVEMLNRKDKHFKKGFKLHGHTNFPQVVEHAGENRATRRMKEKPVSPFSRNNYHKKKRK